MGKAKKTYTAEDIEVLEGLEPVRQRPGMYIAGTDTPQGLHQLAFEILDNSVDEAMNGHADEISLTLHTDGKSITVSDNGRGIPVDKHPKFKKSALELILTTLHAGGKFSDKNYRTAGGLHGVGSSVVNALSKELIATVKRDGKEFEQKFSRGKTISALKTTKQSTRGSGTTIFFRPDDEIFSKINFSSSTLRETLQIKGYLNPGIRFIYIDEAKKTKDEFFYQEGLAAYLQQILIDKKAKVIAESFVLEKQNDIGISVCLAWTEGTSEQFYSYVNGIFTSDGGSHEQGAKAGIVKALRNYMSVHDVNLRGSQIAAEDIREGIVCVVSVRLPGGQYQAQFQGQTKSKLNNPEVAPLVEAVTKNLEQQLNERPSVAEAIISRIILASKARAASREASQQVRRKIGVSHRLTLPGKLADCSSTRPDESELLIVEGDSAGGSAKQGRARDYQAVLPLRGKVLNTIAATGKNVLENKELSNIISALGCGAEAGYNEDKLRYGKVIILTDADADGMHIGTLLLAFFFKYLRPLIEQGRLYLGRPPLFGIYPRKSEKSATEEVGKKRKKAGSKETKAQNSSVLWAYSDEELNGLLKKHKLTEPRVVRFKGLGEMNPETLWETTLDPSERTLLRVQIDDEDMVHEQLNALMGTDPSTRYRLIQENAAKIEVDV